MESNLYDDDEFEGFLKQKVDQFTLYPSEGVWHGIYSSLHLKRNRKWYVATGALLLITTLLFISIEIVSSGYQRAANNIVSDSINNLNAFSTASQSPVLPAARSTATSKTSGTSTITGTASGSSSGYSIPSKKRKIGSLASSALPPQELPLNDGSVMVDRALESSVPVMAQLPASGERSVIPLAKEDGVKPENQDEVIKEREINWLQEGATIRLSRRARFHLQFYVSPAAGYRKMNNYKGDVQGPHVVPVSAEPVDVNGIVDHKPAFGLEAGTALLFNVSDYLVLKGGIQLNYIRYNINAYKSGRELTEITLSNATNSNTAETITTYSSIRNLGGRMPEQLQNQYFQLSMPVGAELRLLGSKRFQLNVAGTLQPAYLLHNKTYLLTSDYANYTQQPDLVRKWNINAAFETYISYSSAGLRWQIGPQFRYQLLSTYTDRYPIREYLMEYGIKIGVSKTLR
ncbi:MAG: hypothetical protein H7Y03_08015 [Chitinophagaceae bacterium]|nr:hypothetical protein [Chitinophagaceae bacterium]